MWILASFYTAIVLAIPFWLKATSIQRLPLPRHEVVAWEAQLPCPIRMHHSITLLVPSEVIKPADRFAVADRIQWSLRAAGDGIKEQRPPKRHYVDQEAEEGKVEGAEAETGTEEEGESLRPLQYAACVDWDVRLADQDEHRSVTGLREWKISTAMILSLTPDIPFLIAKTMRLSFCQMTQRPLRSTQHQLVDEYRFRYQPSYDRIISSGVKRRPLSCHLTWQSYFSSPTHPFSLLRTLRHLPVEYRQ